MIKENERASHPQQVVEFDAEKELLVICQQAKVNDKLDLDDCI